MKDINQYLREHPRNCSRGAPLGDSGYIDQDADKSGRLLCQRLQMSSCGAYGPDGTYWGCGSLALGYVYAIANTENSECGFAAGILQYRRAKSRADAIAQFLSDYPEFQFSRG